jgi:hypothetical protein
MLLQHGNISEISKIEQIDSKGGVNANILLFNVNQQSSISFNKIKCYNNYKILNL